MAAEHPAVTSFEAWRRWRPGGTPCCQFFVTNLQVNAPGCHVHADQVAGTNQGQGTTDIALRGHMQNAGTVAGAAHAGIAEPQHVAHALLDQLERNRQHAPLWHAGATLGPCIAQHQNMVRCDVQVLVVDRRLHLRVAVKDQRRTGVFEVLGRTGTGLDDCPTWRQVAAQHRQCTFGVQRFVQRANHVVVVDLGAGNVLAHATTGNGQGFQLQMGCQPAHQGRQPAGIVKVFHQIGLARRPDVGDHRHTSTDGIEVVQPDRTVRARPAGHGYQVNDCIGGASHGHGDCYAVFKTGPAEHAGRRQVFPHHVHNAASAGGGHAGVAGVRGGDAGGPGQCQSQGFGDAHHGGGGAHRHAGAMAARNACFDFQPLRLGDLAGAAFVPILPTIRARAQHLAFPVAAQHRPGGQVNAGQTS